MSFTFLKQQSDSMNEELVTNKFAPFNFKQLRRYTVHYSALLSVIILYIHLFLERERVFLMCVYTCVVCEISSLALPQTSTAAGDYSSWTSASGSSLGRRNMLG